MGFCPNNFSCKPEATQGAWSLQKLRQRCWDEKMEKEKPPQQRRLVSTRHSGLPPAPLPHVHMCSSQLYDGMKTDSY